MINLKKTLGYGAMVPPSWNHVKIYFFQNGETETKAKGFFRYYSNKSWLNPKGELIADWKMCAWQWIWNQNGEK